MTDQTMQRHFLRPDRVIEGFCQHLRLDVAALRQNDDKSRTLSPLRQQLMWLLRDLTPASLETIGALLGGRNGSTVREAVEKVADQINENVDFRDKMRMARAACIRWATDPLSPPPASVGDGRGLIARVMTTLAVLTDDNLSDADARQAARSILSGLTQAAGVQHV